MTPPRTGGILRILSLGRAHAPLLAFGILVSLASLAAGVALMTLSGATIAGAVAGAAVTASLWLRAAGPARVVLRYAERLITHDATFHALAGLRVWFFRGLAARSAGGLGFRPAGDMLSRLVADVEALDGLYLRVLLPLIGAAIVVPATGLLLGRLGLAVAIGVMLLFGAAAFVLPFAVAREARRAARAQAEAAASLRIAALDTVTFMREVRAFGAEQIMTARIAGRERALIAVQRGLAERGAIAQAAAFLCGQAALLIVLSAAAAPPLLRIAAFFLAIAAFDVLAGLPRAGISAGGATAASRRILDAAEAAPALREPDRPRSVPVDTAWRFDEVHFRWAADQPAVFAGLSMDIPAGTRIALLGPSGSGKSTLAALLLKVAAPQIGRITLGGTDLQELTATDLRRRIAWLSQTTHIFDDTIAANLRLGYPDATEAELWRALDRAAIGDWVRALPDRLETWLGEAGARVSGGQGRRVALARALLSDAPILILDEPCAGLDADTEREFLSTLYGETTSGRTIILIAHRLTGAERLDRIWRLSAGLAIAAAA